MVSFELTEEFRLIGQGEVPFAMAKSDQCVGPAMHDQHRDMQTGKLLTRVIVNAAKPPDRQPGEQLGTDIRDAGKGALKDQTCQRTSNGQFCGYAATQRFAIGDQIGRWKTALDHPLVGRLGIQVSSLLARAACTLAVSTIIEKKHAQPGFKQSFANLRAVADVPAVAMAIDQAWHQGVIRFSREKPRMQRCAIQRIEVYLDNRPTEARPSHRQQFIGMIDLVMFEPSQHDEYYQRSDHQSGGVPGAFPIPKPGHF